MVTKFDFFDGECHAQKGHGDYVKDEDYEALKAERDALAVERDAARNALASIYKTATGELPEWSNWHAYLDDIVEEVGAKLAAIEARGVEKAAEKMQESGAQTFGDCYIALVKYAAELREAK